MNCYDETLEENRSVLRLSTSIIGLLWINEWSFLIRKSIYELEIWMNETIIYFKLDWGFVKKKKREKWEKIFFCFGSSLGWFLQSLSCNLSLPDFLILHNHCYKNTWKLNFYFMLDEKCMPHFCTLHHFFYRDGNFINTCPTLNLHYSVTRHFCSVNMQKISKNFKELSRLIILDLSKGLKLKNQ